MHHQCVVPRLFHSLPCPIRIAHFHFRPGWMAMQCLVSNGDRAVPTLSKPTCRQDQHGRKWNAPASTLFPLPHWSPKCCKTVEKNFFFLPKKMPKIKCQKKKLIVQNLSPSGVTTLGIIPDKYFSLRSSTFPLNSTAPGKFPSWKQFVQAIGGQFRLVNQHRMARNKLARLIQDFAAFVWQGFQVIQLQSDLSCAG